MDHKQKLQKARSLIKAKKYDGAIEILALIDHPNATDWINKTEALRGVQKRKTRKRRTGTLKAILGIILIPVIVVLLLSALNKVSGNFDRNMMAINVTSSCLYIQRNYGGATCDSDTVIAQHPEAVAFCYRIYKDNSFSSGGFAVCLESQGAISY